jgi:hypothetical protein
MSRAKIYIGAAFLVALVAMPLKAAQACPCATTGDVQNAIREINRHTDVRIDDVVAAIAKESLQISGTVENASKAEIASQTDNQNAAVKEQTDHDTELERNRAIRQQQPQSSACITIMSGSKMIPVSGTASQVGDIRRSYDDKRNSNSVPETAGTTTSTSASVNNRHYEKFCAPDDVRANMCSLSQLPNGDQVAKSLVLNSGIEIRSPQDEAAQAYIENVTNAVPPPDLTEDQRRSAAGAGAEALRGEFQSRVSLAQLLFQEQFERNTVTGVDLTPDIIAGWGQDGLQLFATTDEQGNRVVPTKVMSSVERMITWEANRRFSNPKWHDETVIGSTDPMQTYREMMEMQAFQIYLQWRQYQLQQRQALVDAAILSVMARDYYNDNRSGVSRTAGASTGGGSSP